ncbi:MAG: hypothetical protein R2681_17595 [Pyrinomonadaceae bacterium]
MFELKKISHEAIPSAIEKAKHYRLLNEPGAAESICRDVLETDPDNQEALITIVLAMSDRLQKDYVVGSSGIQDYLSKIAGEYESAYYSGIVFERRAKAMLHKGVPGSDSTAYELFSQAMKWFEKAESVRPEGNDDAILRWNGCARMITSNNLSQREMASDFLE